MPLRITVNVSTKEEWENIFLNISKSNLMQSWQYGEVKKNVEGWTARRLIFSGDGGKVLAIAQILEKKIPILGTIVRLNRGPIFLDKLDNDLIFAIWDSLNMELNSIKRGMIQIAPELPPNTFLESKFVYNGYKKRNDEPWTSGTLDLEIPEEQLLMQLDGKWRNGLRKGIKLVSRVETYTYQNAQDLNRLSQNYKLFKKEKKFFGIPDKIVSELSKQNGEGWRFNLYSAYVANYTDPVGMLVSISHGKTETYVIGFSNEVGRKNQVNSVLLWHSIINAKNNFYKCYDLGGISTLSTQSVAKFKLGLNPEVYSLIGEFRKYIFKFI